jgi:hypothetical protein
VRRDASRDFQQSKMEMTMRKKIFAGLAVPLVAALTVQAAAASERHRTRTKGSPMASEQLRNSKAYAGPGYFAVPSRLQQRDNGAFAGAGGR